MNSTLSSTLIPTGTWAIDPTHSTIGFSVKHVGIATVRGSFDTFSGTFTAGPTLEESSIETTIATASVNTSDEQRDGHLRSADFFDAETFPEITFRSTQLRPVDEHSFEVTGDLTLHGVTRPVTLEAKLEGFETDPWGNERLGLELTGQLNRGEFGMTFNQALGSGNLLVSDKVKITLDIAAIKQAA
jgi:polyisoprenoid-binding protein YceI